MASMRGIDQMLHGQLLRHQERLQYQSATVKCTKIEAYSENLCEELSTTQYSSSAASLHSIEMALHCIGLHCIWLANTQEPDSSVFGGLSKPRYAKVACDTIICF